MCLLVSMHLPSVSRKDPAESHRCWPQCCVGTSGKLLSLLRKGRVRAVFHGTATAQHTGCWVHAQHCMEAI